MPQIALELIRPNPFRDFDLHPIDAEQVEKLKASIEADGFWASVVARRVAGEYQIAFGHHRIEAARQLGRQEAPIEVRDLSDWQMVRMLASENATQRGSTAAACLDAVAAMSRVLAYSLLRWDEATFAKNLAGVALDFPTCRGMLGAGKGVGRSCIAAFAPKDAFSRIQIEDALGVLKDSGRMAAIVAAAHERAAAELQAEQEAAEHELEAAQRREAAARTKRDRDTAAKETTKAKKNAVAKGKAIVSADKAVTSVQREPIIFDARCTKLFKLDTHARTFRQIVTGDTFKAFLPFNKQYEFAQSVLAALRENMPNKEVTARDIRAECWSRVESGLNLPKGKLRTAPERPYLEEIKEGLNLLRRAEGDFKRGVALLLRGFQLGERLDAKQAERLGKIESTFAAGWDGMKQYRENVKRHLKLIGEE
jgi:ParB-like chromosome segregation protein Spo0J